MKQNKFGIGGWVLLFAALSIVITPLSVAKSFDLELDGEPRGLMSYYPTEYDFGAIYKGETASTTFEIWVNAGCCSIDYVLTWDASWIEVFPTSGVSTGEHDTITVTIDTTELEIGYYTELIHIDSNDNDEDFTVYVNVIETPDATLEYEPKSYDFGDILQGKQYETTFRIWNSGTEPLYYNLTWDDPCISVNPTIGTSVGESDEITIQIDLTDVPLGEFIEEINIETNNNSGLFTLSANVMPLPYLSFSTFSSTVFSLKTSLNNHGTVEAPNVAWSIRLEGGSILFGHETGGSFDELAGGETVNLQTSFIFGFGKTKIHAEVKIGEDVINKREQDATVFLSLIIVKPGGG
jgi:phage-related protein